jgi:hypothetical protein
MRTQKNSVSKTIISTSNMKGKRSPLPHSEGEKEPETCAALSYSGIERTIIDLWTEARYNGPKASPIRRLNH